MNFIKLDYKTFVDPKEVVAVVGHYSISGGSLLLLRNKERVEAELLTPDRVVALLKEAATGQVSTPTVTLTSKSTKE